MVEKGKGTIVNVGSVVGRIGMPFSGAYSASKFALEGMSESMRMELWPLGVRVAIVEPGLFRTRFLENQVSSEQAGSDALPHGGKEARGGERKEYGRLGGRSGQGGPGDTKDHPVAAAGVPVRRGTGRAHGGRRKVVDARAPLPVAA